MRLLFDNVPAKIGLCFPLQLYFFFVSWLTGSAASLCLVLEQSGFSPRIRFEPLNSPSRTIGFLCSLSIRYRSTAITVHERYHARYLSRLSYELLRKMPREVCLAPPIHIFQCPKLVPNFWLVVCALFCVFIFGILYQILNLKCCYLLLTSPPFCFVAVCDSPGNQIVFIFLQSISTFCPQSRLCVLFGIN